MAFTISPILLIGACVACLGELLHIVGLATTGWSVQDSDNQGGLFRLCSGGTCRDIEDYPIYDDHEDELKAVQAMTILGMLCGLVAAGIAVLTVVFNFMSKSLPKIASSVCLLAGVAAGVTITIGVIVYAATIHDDFDGSVDLGYSFGLCIVGAILIPAGSVLNYVGSKSASIIE